MKKSFAVIIILALCLTLCLSCVSAGAEDVLSAISTIPTTQAFTADSIPAEDIDAIVSAGLSAASAINQQPWFFTVITDPDVMAELKGNGGMPAGAAPEGAPAGAPEGIPASAPEGVPASAPEGIPASAPEGVPASAPEGVPAGAPAAPTGNGSSAKAALGDSPVAIVIYMNESTPSPDPNFDCGLACQNMIVAADLLGYGSKVISSPTRTLNGDDHDALCEKLGVDPSYKAVAVLLLGVADTDETSSASVRGTLDEKVSYVTK